MSEKIPEWQRKWRNKIILIIIGEFVATAIAVFIYLMLLSS